MGATRSMARTAPTILHPMIACSPMPSWRPFGVPAATPWRVHDIRRSVATGMADIGIEPHVIEEILNHRSGHRRGVAGVYNRSPYEKAVRLALARWADHVLALVEGRAPADNVLAFG